MSLGKKLFVGIPTALVLLLAGLFWLAFFSARPPLATEAETLAGDGSLINYCELPKLDGGGKLAAEIPKGNTPGLRLFSFSLANSCRMYRAFAARRGRHSRFVDRSRRQGGACGANRAVRPTSGRHGFRNHS